LGGLEYRLGAAGARRQLRPIFSLPALGRLREHDAGWEQQVRLQ
jgi:hypothetical protein